VQVTWPIDPHSILPLPSPFQARLQGCPGKCNHLHTEPSQPVQLRAKCRRPHMWYPIQLFSMSRSLSEEAWLEHLFDHWLDHWLYQWSS
jgi:hypothetical protein